MSAKEIEALEKMLDSNLFPSENWKSANLVGRVEILYCAYVRKMQEVANLKQEIEVIYENMAGEDI